MSLRYRRMMSSYKRDWWLAGGISPDVAFQPKGAESYAKSLMNLTGVAAYDAYTGLGVTAPDWDDANGWMFDGIDNGLWSDGFVVGDSNYTFIMRYSNFAPQNAVIFGVTRNETSAVFTWLNYNEDGLAYIGYSNNQSCDGFNSAGVFGLSVSDGYFNGVPLGFTFNGWTVNATHCLGIGFSNYVNDGLYYFAQFHCQALYAVHKTLTDAQVLAVSVAMAAL